MTTPSICGPGNRVRSYLAELLQLSSGELRPVIIPLQATLTTSVLTLSDSNYVVPSDQDLYIYSIAGYLASNALASEPTAMLGWLNLDPSERFLVKAMNCVVQLEDVSRTYKFFEGREATLASIMPPFGSPVQFPVETPIPVSAKHSLKATFTLQDTAAATVGASTDYGVQITGVLVPHRGAR
ncbi:MAG: hypothetical protein WC700_18210 [Gemmatimonadaceae bacterium]|jgi:hypothetical protein